MLNKKFAAILVLPAIITIFLVAGYPFAYAVYKSFFNSNIAVPDRNSFIGIQNYLTVLTDQYWWTAVSVTLIITFVSLFFEFILGLVIALVMRYTLRLSTLVRVCVLIPYGIVTTVSAYSWLYAWTDHTGYLANLLPAGSAPLTHKWTSIAIIILAEVWKTTPFLSLIFLSGITQIDDVILTAATLDGASPFQKLTKIILPMILPQISVGLMLRTLDAFRVFDNIYILTRGSNSTYSVSVLGYDNLFLTFNVGLGSAIAVLIFVCTLIITLAYTLFFGIQRRKLSA